MADKSKQKQIPWNKGKKLGFIPISAFKKGQIPWNKGKCMTKNFSRSSSNQNIEEKKFYKVWVSIRNRCLETNKQNKQWYFDKGITLCDRWQNFEYFFIDMWDNYLIHRKMNNGNTQIDRKNNSKGYFKQNCHWVTSQENVINRSVTKLVKGKTLSEWGRILGVNEWRLRARLRRDWKEEEDILLTTRYKRIN